jgi:hypothetical protein
MRTVVVEHEKKKRNITCIQFKRPPPAEWVDLVKSWRQMIQWDMTQNYTCTFNEQEGSGRIRDIRTISLLHFIFALYKLVFALQNDLGHAFAAASNTH